MEYKKYLLKTYGAWLGKVIGVRLGAPVEGWDYSNIRKWYGHYKKYYLDYDIFASDDDTNGPLFFVRPLLEKNDITEKDIGQAMLDYICQYKGFFWWGGVGVSTENTAYENLIKGIIPPQSGSVKQNGQAIAEQIGGQIFIDCWGYVSGGNPKQAKRFAQMAACVTHDRCGIEGAIFVAVCIALAYENNDIHKVIDEALTYLNPSLEYYQVVKDIIRIYHSGVDFETCFNYIHEHYGYDKYPGVCHIIPNSALMIAGMLYGENDFEKTLLLINNGGWDTDCNCGNVGSIMGALVGIENINPKWIEPINDILNASSSVGCLNITTVSQTAKMFAKLAFKLQNQEIVDDKHFDLPYATEGFRGDVKASSGSLLCKGEVSKFVYYLKNDIFDSRYDPSFSPLLFPGNTITVKANKDITVFAELCDGTRYEGVNSLYIPTTCNAVVRRVGFAGDEYVVYDYSIERETSLDYDFASLLIDEYTHTFRADEHPYNIRSFCDGSGAWIIDNGLCGYGQISTGHLDSTYQSITVSFTLKKGNEAYLLYNMQHNNHYQAIGVLNNELVVRDAKTIQKRWPLPSDTKAFTITVGEDGIIVNDRILDFVPGKLVGLVGFKATENSEICCHNLKTK